MKIRNVMEHPIHHLLCIIKWNTMYREEKTCFGKKNNKTSAEK